MERQSELESLERKHMVATKKSCEHGRLIDAILTERGTPTGKARCLECGTVIDDPHHPLR